MIITVASFLGGLLGTLFFLVALFMILVVLIQKPKGGGLSGAFGAGGGGGGGDQQAMFGAKVGDVLTIITVCCFVAFILLAIGLVYVGQQSAEAEPTDRTQAVGEVPIDEDMSDDDADGQPDATAPATTPGDNNDVDE